MATNTKTDDDVREVFSMLGELETAGPLSESIGDNTVDNMITELKRATTIEMGRFTAYLLANNTRSFLHSYVLPKYDFFKEIFQDTLNRYNVMDGDEQGDLFRKIENLFKDIMREKLPDIPPEESELIAQRYSVQMIGELKKHAISPNMDREIDKSEVWY